ncbi:MAG: ATP synthase subunit I [Kangiellaceae bacterium]|nr:ATP synthase subunit I [Kangiellaceae bacterium]
MSQSLIKRGFQQAKQLLIIQFVLLIAIASFGLIKNFQVTVALLSGEMAVFLANLYFVFKVFAKSGAQANKQVVKAFYLGETVKIVISVGLLIVAFMLLPGTELFVLVGYIAALLMQWLTPVIVKTH